MIKNNIYNKGDTVPENGIYVCVPCGYKKELKVGNIFSECTSCLAGTEEGDEEYVTGTGMWEKFSENKSSQ